MTSADLGWKHLTLRRDGTCSGCGIALTAGTVALWNSSKRIVSCIDHDESDNDLEQALHNDALVLEQEKFGNEFNHGIAGGSARAENERRIKKREERVTKRFPRAGKYILALTGEPQSTQAWKTGAEGEVAIGEKLDSLAQLYGFETLHDRRIPRSLANIDHIAVTTAGVFVVDTKHYQGMIQVKYRGWLFSKRTSELWVGNRNQTKLVSRVQKQVGIVEEVLRQRNIEMPVTGVLAFYNGLWARLSFFRPKEIDGILLNSKGIEPIVSKQGSHSAAEINTTLHLLAERLRSATNT